MCGARLVLSYVVKVVAQHPATVKSQTMINQKYGGAPFTAPPATWIASLGVGSPSPASDFELTVLVTHWSLVPPGAKILFRSSLHPNCTECVTTL